MTTFSSYLEAFAHPASTRASRQWVVSPAAQRIYLVLIDLLVITVTMVAAVNVRSLPVDVGSSSPIMLLPAIGALWIGLIRVFGGYHLRHQRAGSVEYKRTVMAAFTTAGTVGITSYLLNADFSRAVFVMLFTVGTIGLLGVRFIRRRVMHAVHRQGALLTPVVVAGESGHIDAIAKVLRRETWLGYRVVGAVTRDRVTQTPGGLPVLGSVTDTVGVIDEHSIGTVIFAEGSFSAAADFRRMAWEMEEQNVHMIVVPNLTDISAQRLEVRPVAGLPLVDVARPQAIEAARWIKRTFDIVGSSFLLLLAAPVMAFAALAIKLEDGGPVVFRQRRVGLKGQEFDCLKFRSMCVDAEARLAALAAENEGAGPCSS